MSTSLPFPVSGSTTVVVLCLDVDIGLHLGCEIVYMPRRISDGNERTFDVSQRAVKVQGALSPGKAVQKILQAKCAIEIS